MSIEPLESRIAPASLTFTDIDGDDVTITTSKGTLALGVNVFVVSGQLQRLDLTDPAFENTGVSIMAKPGATGGDGRVHVGAIDATGRHLGAVTVDGDLGQIDAGNSAAGAVAIKSLSVLSLGEFGTTTQAAGGSLVSTIDGGLGKLVVLGNIDGARIDVGGGAAGKIGSISIGGSLIGGSTSFSGTVVASGDIGAVKIGGSILGGAAQASGALSAGGKMGAVTIGEDIVGGGGTKSGYLVSSGSAAAITIGGDLRGSFATTSGAIEVFGALPKLTISGEIAGSGGVESGRVYVGGKLGIAQVKLGIAGSSGTDSGTIRGEKDIASILIAGSVIGGFDPDPNDAEEPLRAGSISSAGKIGSLAITGDLRGGTGDLSGRIDAQGAVGVVKIGGDIAGGAGLQSGILNVPGGVGAITVGGSLIGSFAPQGGRIVGSTAGAITIAGEVAFPAGLTVPSIDFDKSGAVKIGLDVTGRIAIDNAPSISIGGDLSTGVIVSTGKLGSVTIAGSIIGTTTSGTGFIDAATVDKITIGGDLRGGFSDIIVAANNSGSIRAADKLGAVVIGGSIISGSSSGGIPPVNNGSIVSGGTIGSVLVKGGILGNSIARVVISAEGTQATSGTTDLAIKSVTVLGRVEYARILGGFNTNGVGTNADAQIGTVTAGEWIASDIAAGVERNMDGSYGTADDALIAEGGAVASIVSKIGAIVIKGHAYGTTGAGDHFGFVAQQVGSVTIGGQKFGLTAAPNEVRELGGTGDFSVREDV